MSILPDDDDVIFVGAAGRTDVLANGRRLLATQPRAAAAQAREVLERNSRDREALLLLSAALRQLGLLTEALETERAAIAATAHEPVLTGAAVAIRERRLNEAEHLLRPFLARHPCDPAALRLLAEVGVLAGARVQAQDLLRQALEAAPGYRSARLRLASLLTEESRVDEALDVLDAMLALDPDDASVLGSKAATLGRIGDFNDAARLYQRLVEQSPNNPALWLSLGHVRNTLGDLSGSIDAYRRAADLEPQAGVIWWSLANLKAFRFDDADIARMEEQLESDGLSDDHQLHLHFALGKAYEDRRQPEASFAHYAAGNALRKAEGGFDPGAHRAMVNEACARIAPDLLVHGQADPALGTPIFIVGMPRAGSTLIEQILASHSMIEGTAELPVLPLLVSEVVREQKKPYSAAVDGLSAQQLAELGRRYLEATQVYRKTSKPLFVDKLPNNWLHSGLIHRVLPGARIIDARRHPLDCGWSLFKQNFARGQSFSYDLADIGSYYLDYVRLMAAMDQHLPARVHRVIHEELVADSERQIRALLRAVGVPFEDSVLRFYENERAVRTPSAAQVRRPINREGMERWRAYDRWLDPLKEALGDLLASYPEVPSTF